MAIQELSEEQVRTMTLKEKDEWWLKNVYKGDMPQLTLRSAITGALLGGILGTTNLYIGIKTGWTLGVGVSSVVLSYAIFKLMARLRLGSEMTVLENNAMQSIATSAGYMTAPMMASIPAYMMVTGQVIPIWHTIGWVIVLAVLGVLFAFPLKKRFINDEQLRFPEGYASGVVLDSLHSEDGAGTLFKAKLLLGGAGLSALVETMRSEKVMSLLRLDWLTLPSFWDDFIYKFATPRLWGTPLKNLTIQWDTSLVMMGTGGLMSMKTAMSLLLGGLLNYFILAPVMLSKGIIPEANFKHIIMWSLWGGAAMMTTSSLYSFFAKPEIIFGAFKKMFTKSQTKEKDVLADIELPMWIFAVGIPTVGALTVYMGHAWFGIHYTMGLIAIPLVFLLTVIAVNSTGLTAVTPGSAMSKITQLTYSVLAPGNTSTNLMTAGITTEVSLNASNLLMDIKPGYMLGGKPRHQAIGHLIGVVAGSLVAVPLFYRIFHGDISLFTSDVLPLPSAAVWKSVAEVLTKGVATLHPSTQVAILIGALAGIICEFINDKMKGKFAISGTSFGLAFVLRFTDIWLMAVGCLFFWLCGRVCKDKESFGYRAFVDNQDTVAAGIIAGGSIIGIILLMIETSV